MSLNNSLSKSVNEARTDNCKVLSHRRCPAGKKREPRVVIQLLLERDGQKRRTRLLYLVTKKQRKKVTEDIENEGIISGIRWECLKLRSNT